MWAVSEHEHPRHPVQHKPPEYSESLLKYENYNAQSCKMLLTISVFIKKYYLKNFDGIFFIIVMREENCTIFFLEK